MSTSDNASPSTTPPLAASTSASPGRRKRRRQLADNYTRPGADADCDTHLLFETPWVNTDTGEADPRIGELASHYLNRDEAFATAFAPTTQTLLGWRQDLRWRLAGTTALVKRMTSALDALDNRVILPQVRGALRQVGQRVDVDMLNTAQEQLQQALKLYMTCHTAVWEVCKAHKQLADTTADVEDALNT